MPVQIGGKAESDFNTPLGLLSDCHRRIENFLALLIRVAHGARGRVLSAEDRAALEKALDYFRDSAPQHTADEEESLFPRLRGLDHPLANSALASIDALEADHVAAAADHAVVDSLGRRWLEHGALSADEHGLLNGALDRLSAVYVRHIAVEDAEVFPLAGKILQANDLASMGDEMARRRGLRR